jgi:hypothetical protein
MMQGCDLSLQPATAINVTTPLSRCGNDHGLNGQFSLWEDGRRLARKETKWHKSTL